MVKRMKYCFILFCILITFLLSCSKDEEVRGNHFQIEEDNFEIAAAQLVNLGESNGVNQLVLTFVSEGVQLRQPDVQTEAVSGKGDVLFFYLNAPDTIINQGDVYTYADDEGVNTYQGEYHISWDIASDQEEYSVELAEGMLEISRSANLYVILFDGKDATNNTVELYYKGELLYY